MDFFFRSETVWQWCIESGYENNHGHRFWFWNVLEGVVGILHESTQWSDSLYRGLSVLYKNKVKMTEKFIVRAGILKNNLPFFTLFLYILLRMIREEIGPAVLINGKVALMILTWWIMDLVLKVNGQIVVMKISKITIQ